VDNRKLLSIPPEQLQNRSIFKEMSFPISSYFHFTLALSTIYIVVININVGLSYFIATLPLFFFTSRWVKLPKEYVPFFLIAATSIWAFYLVRPLLLLVRPDLFYYSRTGTITNEGQIYALFQIAIYSLLFLSGLYLAVIVGYKKRRHPSPFFDSNKPGLILKNKQVIILAVCVIILFDLYLLLGRNIGVSGTYSPLAFIRLFLPLGLIMPVLALYLLKYRRYLTRAERFLMFSIIGVIVLTTLLQGHKAALLYVAEIFFLTYLLEKGDFKISLPKILFFGGPVFIITFVTFPVAMSIRTFMQLHGFSFDIFGILFESLSSLADKDFLLIILDMVTRRFCGYDGLLAVNLYSPPELDNIFDVFFILKRAMASLVPKFYVEGIGLGKAVGVYYSGHSFDITHAGALGLFASIILIGKGFMSYVYIISIGIFFGICFNIANKFKGYGPRELISIIFSLQLIGWVISGNLDSHLTAFIVALVHLTFYYSACWFMYKACRC